MRASLLLFLIACTTLVQAQTLQLHYDFRNSFDSKNNERNFPSASFEMSRTDRIGHWRMKTDLDLSDKNGNIGGIYTEISRSVQIGDIPLQLHAEYNGGAGYDAYPIKLVKNAYIGGFEYPFELGNLDFNTYIAYRYNNFARASHDVQWSCNWTGKVIYDLFTFSGFIDIWSRNQLQDSDAKGKRLVLWSEPQLWLNLADDKFGIGTEMEISANLYEGVTGLHAYPTLAIRYKFN